MGYLITLNVLQFPLELCTGDCDADEDCAGVMTCAQRDGLAEVPGCVGLGIKDVDYCTHPINWLSLSDARPLGLCKGDCDDDDECDEGLICEQRDGFDEILGCEGRGTENSDYCRFPDDVSDVVATTIAATPAQPPTTTYSPSNHPSTLQPIDSSTTCMASGEACFDKKLCCSNKCEKDAMTGEKVCSNPPEKQPPDTCTESGQACFDKKKCCSGVCEKDPVTKREICGTMAEPSDEDKQSFCRVAGDTCIDKKSCCSGRCVKKEVSAEKENGIETGKKAEKVKEEVCG